MTSILVRLLKTFRQILLLTDLEPDDLWALYVLLCHLLQLQFKGDILIVTSCSPFPERKCSWLRQWIETHFPSLSPLVTCIPGHATATNHPFFQPFEAPGNGPLIDGPREREKEKVILKFLEDHPQSLILQWAPPLELVHLHQERRDLFASCCLMGYMSFNLRTLLWSPSKDVTAKEVVEYLNGPWQEVLFFESYRALGENNTLEDLELLEGACSNSSLPGAVPELRELLGEWNHHIRKSALKKIQASLACLGQNGSEVVDFQAILDLNLLETRLKSLTLAVGSDPTLAKSQAQMNRSLKILRSIQRCPLQVLMADLALSLLICCLPADHASRFRRNVQLPLSPDTFFDPQGYTCLKFLPSGEGSLDSANSSSFWTIEPPDEPSKQLLMQDLLSSLLKGQT